MKILQSVIIGLNQIPNIACRESHANFTVPLSTGPVARHVGHQVRVRIARTRPSDQLKARPQEDTLLLPRNATTRALKSRLI